MAMLLSRALHQLLGYTKVSGKRQAQEAKKSSTMDPRKGPYWKNTRATVEIQNNLLTRKT